MVDSWEPGEQAYYQCDECGLEYTSRRGVEDCNHALPEDQAEEDDLDLRRERHIQAQLEGRDPEWSDASTEADYLPWQIWYRLEWSGEWIELRGERYRTLAEAEARMEELCNTTTNRQYRVSFF